MNGSCTTEPSVVAFPTSTTADELDDLDAIARGEDPIAVRGARHDVLVDFDCDPTRHDPEPRQQSGDAQRIGHLVWLAVDGQLHGAMRTCHERAVRAKPRRSFTTSTPWATRSALLS